jgi:ornithine carbamoyltransferase
VLYFGAMTSLKGKSLLSIAQLEKDDIYRLIGRSLALKKSVWSAELRGKTMALLFEKPSLRTRVSFDLAMHQLGGYAIYLSPAEVGLGKREAVQDVARVLDRFVDVLAVRSFSQSSIELLSASASIPVINALSDAEHPCQILADMVTIYEHEGKLEGLTLAYIGDGNNVASSLILASTMVGINFKIASPEGYTLPEHIISKAKSLAEKSGADILVTQSPEDAARGADIIYTDVWTSMGQEAETEIRRKAFQNYQINERLFALAKNDAIFMHPLPAHRGEEVTDGVLEGANSVIFDQAENRLHLAKALLLEIFGF